MPRNGSGTYTAPSNSANPAVPFTTISSTAHNAVLNDLVAALTDSLSRSGSGGMTAALAMGSNKITGLANGTDATDAINKGQADTAYQAASTALSALAALATTGHIVRTGAATYATRTITGSAGRVTVTNGDGVSGNPTIDWDGVQVRKNSAGSTFTRRRVNLIEGSNITLTVADDAGGDEVDVTITSTATTSISNGSVINSVIATYASNANLTTLIPYDDTIPTSTEGTQILSAALTPASTTNKIRARFFGFGTTGTAGDVLVAAMFNGGASAVQVTAQQFPTANYLSQLAMEFEYTPGSVAEQTITVRVGAAVATARMNGTSTARQFGGAAACTLVLEEIKA